MSLYGVETKALNQAVTRNLGRFPERYSFKLTPEEAEDVRSQIVTLSGESARSAWWRYPPRAFTEQGVAMLSAVLRGAKAVEVSIGIMDAFSPLAAVARALFGRGSASVVFKSKVRQDDDWLRGR